MLVNFALFILAFGVLYLLSGTKSQPGVCGLILAVVLLIILLTVASRLNVDTTSISTVCRIVGKCS